MRKKISVVKTKNPQNPIKMNPFKMNLINMYSMLSKIQSPNIMTVLDHNDRNDQEQKDAGHMGQGLLAEDLHKDLHEGAKNLAEDTED